MISPSTSWNEIERLLDEPLAAAEERERTEFDRLRRESDGTVVLFGAGSLGRLSARALRRGGVPVRAFCDGNLALQGKRVEGAEVLSPMEAAARYGVTSLFVVAIWTGTARESMSARIKFLQSCGCRFVTSFAPLLWRHGREDTPYHSFELPSRTLAHAAEFRRLDGLLADDASRRVLLGLLRQRLHGRFDDAPPSPDQYFPADLVALRTDEGVVDGGAYTGDTLEDFLRRTEMRFQEYHAFEPDAGNARRLRDRVALLPRAVADRIWIHPMALHSRPASLAFSNEGLPASRVDAAAAASVQADALDNVMGGSRVTFVKLDVEGAEPDALAGAVKTLSRCAPVAAVCTYHAPQDVWQLPFQLHAAMPSHHFFLRQHAFDGWETVCYAIPPDRVPKALDQVQAKFSE